MTRILLVEDEVIIGLSAATMLESVGYVVDNAYDGVEALERLKASPPDIIITDFMMPRMDGLALIAHLRGQAWSSPIILATAIPERDLPEGYQGGHDIHLNKPYGLSELLAAVRKALECSAEGAKDNPRPPA